MEENQAGRRSDKFAERVMPSLMTTATATRRQIILRMTMMVG